jgi:hypothetical protein
MMGHLKSDQGQLFYEFVLAMPFPKITWCGRSTLPSICPGSAANLHPTIRPWVARSIDPELMIQMLVADYVFAIRSVRSLCCGEAGRRVLIPRLT